MLFLGAVATALPAWAAPQQARIEDVTPHPAQAAGVSLLTTIANVVYFPVRLAVTAVTGELGGLTGWLTGGDVPAARSIWKSTDGQPYIKPAILEGRERLRFGS
jgi:hypothetical protein